MVADSLSSARKWALWRNKPAAVVLFLASDVLVLGLVALQVTRYAANRRDWLIALLLLGIAVTFEEGATRVARLEWRLGSDLKRDMTSVWAVAAAVALPPTPGTAMVAAVYLHVWWRQRRPAGSPAHRALFSGQSVVIGCLAAGYAVRALPQFGPQTSWGLPATLAVLVAIILYTGVNRSAITLALTAFGTSAKQIIGTVDDNLTELSTLCLGGLVAVAAIHNPWLCVLVLLPMAMLQRGSFVREIETAAVTDAKTGLLNAVGWEHLAQRELGRARREKYPVSVLIVDVDLFKRVNDSYGHLVGDQVLRGLARTMTAALREYDTVGRFGGEEFVAVLPETDERTAVEVAERIRSLVNLVTLSSVSDADAQDVLSVSVGVATAPPTALATTELTSLLVSADRALYRAKNTGRNRVCLADDPPGQVDLQDA